MAVIYPSLSAAWYGFPGGTSWTSSSVIYSGVSSSSNYRSKVQVDVGDFDGTASHLIVSLTIDGTSSPAGMYGVLSTRNDIYPKQTVSDTYYGNYTNGPHPDYLASGCTGYIAESDTYSDAACTTLQGSHNQSSGHTVYLKFSSSAIAPNTTYYLYLMRYIKSGDSTSSGWTRGQLSAMTATLTYTQNTYYIDVNTYVNGGGNASRSDILYCVDINGSRAMTNGSDYYTAHPKGTTWSAWVSSCPGYTLLDSWGTSGTVGTSNVEAGFSYATNHTITFMVDGAVHFVTGSDPTVYYGSTNYYDVSWITPTKAGHNFKGWYTATSGGTQVYDSNGVCIPGTSYWNASSQYIYAANLTLYAQWDPHTYTISYSPNGGSSTPADQTKTYGVALTLRGAISRSNATKTITTTFNGNGGTPMSPTISSIASLRYSFAGWKATNGTVYSAGSSYTANEGTTLTAQWNSSEWEGEAIILPNASRDGYSFTGWYTAATGGSKVTSLSPTANTTLYAHWSVNAYTIRLLDEQTGEVFNSYSVDFGDTITLPAISSFDNYYTEYGSGYFNVDTGVEVLTIEGTCSETLLPSCFYNSYDNSYFTGTTFTLQDAANIDIFLSREYTGFDVFKCTLPEAAFFNNGNDFVTAESVVKSSDVPSFMPNSITPTSHIEIQYVYDDYQDSFFGTYQAVYRQESGVHVWIKQDGTYKLASSLRKNTTNFVQNEGCLVKLNGHWVTLTEYYGLTLPDYLDTTLDSGLLDSIILA